MSPRPPFPPPPAPAKSGKQRLIIGLLLGIVLLGGLVSFLMSGSKGGHQAPKAESIVTITLPPPPPPPPPPPKVEPPKTEPPPEEQKQEVAEEEPTPAPVNEPAPADPPEEVLGTNIQGNGPGLSGLGSRGNGGGTRNSVGGGSSQQARVDWYAKRVLVSTIKQALERDPATRHLIMDDGVRVWVDAEGRILRIRPLGSTGNQAALERVLIGLRTSQAPPSGMPASIDFKIKARKPSA